MVFEELPLNRQFWATNVRFTGILSKPKTEKKSLKIDLKAKFSQKTI